MKKVFHSLAFKLGLAIFGIASLSFAGLGIYYTRLFSRQIDEQLRVQALIPGQLVNQQALPYRTARDTQALSRLVGEKVLCAAVTRTDGRIHYCTDWVKEGTLIDCEQSRHNGSPEINTLNLNEENTPHLHSITALSADGTPLGELHMMIDTSQSKLKKKAVIFVFATGGLLCVLVITLAGALLIRQLTMPRIHVAAKCLQQIASGQVDARIAKAESFDELGFLERNINRMAQHLAVRRQEDLRLNAELATAKDEAEKRYILLNTIFETVTDHIYYMDQNGRILGANPACCKHHGRQLEQMIGKNDLDFYGEEIGRPIYEQGVKTRKTRETLRRRETHKGPKGTPIHLESIKSPLIDHAGNVFGLAGISRDITHQVKIEEELVQSQKAAESANQAKSAFLAMMSHEIRTPLNAVLGHAQIIGRECKNCPSQKSAIPSIIKSGQHLLDLINDILEISRTENRAVHLSPSDFDFHELLESLLAVSGQRSDSHTSLQILRADAVPRYIRADQTKIRQILINLVGNAIKFTDEGQILISAGLTPTDKTTELNLSVDIQDTGCGIAPDETELVFKPFEYATSRPGMREGTGLGLTLSRRYAQAMGGDVVLLHSVLGKGSTFRFTFTAQLAGGDLFAQASPSTVTPSAAQDYRRKMSMEEFWKVPQTYRDALQEAVRFGRIHQMRSTVDAIQAGHPLVANELTRLIDGYDYEKLTQLLNRKYGET